jgi:hypothetical protein
MIRKILTYYAKRLDEYLSLSITDPKDWRLWDR